MSAIPSFFTLTDDACAGFFRLNHDFFSGSFKKKKNSLKMWHLFAR